MTWRWGMVLMVVAASALGVVSWRRGWWRAPAAGVSADDVSTGERALRAVGVGWTDRKPNDLEDLITPEGLPVVRGADRVEFFKLEVTLSERGIEWSVDQRRDGGGGELSKARGVLLSPDVYSWDRRGGHKRCGGFQPRDAVRFWKGKESVLFLICFTCSDVGVVAHDSAGRARKWMIADVGRGKGRLRELMEGVFPGSVKDGH